MHLTGRMGFNLCKTGGICAGGLESGTLAKPTEQHQQNLGIKKSTRSKGPGEIQLQKLLGRKGGQWLSHSWFLNFLSSFQSCLQPLLECFQHQEIDDCPNLPAHGVAS